MKKKEAIFEREILASSGDEIAAFDVKLYGDRIDGKLVVLITSKSEQDPKIFCETLLNNIDAEIFKRINVNMVTNVQVVMLFDGSASKVIFDSDSSLMPLHIEPVDVSYLDQIEY